MEVFSLLPCMINSSANTTFFLSFSDFKGKPYLLYITRKGYKARAGTEATAVLPGWGLGDKKLAALCCRNLLWLHWSVLMQNTGNSLSGALVHPGYAARHRGDFVLPFAGAHLISHFICHSAKERTSLLGLHCVSHSILNGMCGKFFKSI